MSRQRRQVLISGGGIGGLALAQGLKKAGIPFHVFESDPTPTFRPQGYRFRVSPEGAEALQKLLSPELWQRFQKVCAQEATFGSRLNAIDAQPSSLTFGGGGPPRREGKSYTADRTITRDLLLRGLENDISFGKRVVRYEETSDSVTAFFADGSSASGTFLVGAEGLRSVVRKQHLPDYVVLDTECRCIYGKTQLTDEVVRRFNPAVTKGISILSDDSHEHTVVLLLETIQFQENDLRDELPDDYIYCVLVSDKANFHISNHDLLHLSGEETAKLSLEITEKWHPSFQALLELQEKEMTSALRISTASPQMYDWVSSSKVTLIGDAAHVMPPTGGVGANTALQDAAALCETLSEDVTQSRISEYDGEMRKRARQAIAGSARGGKMMVGMRNWETFKAYDP